MKICTKCQKLTDNFWPDKRKKDWMLSCCRQCYILKLKKYYKTIPGLITKVYSQQRHNSKKRGNPLPTYSNKELLVWIKEQLTFEILYKNREGSWYKTQLIPSIDRIDDYKWYSLDNIQLMTWEENKQKGHEDRRNWINNKHNKVVLGTHKITWKQIKYHSIHEAGRQTWITISNISDCCRWKRCKSAWGYRWIFV